MVKKELIKLVAKHSGMEPTVVERVLATYVDEVKRAVAEGKAVHWRGFGTFQPVLRKPKVGRRMDRRTGQSTALVIPERKRVLFKPSDQWTAVVQDPALQPARPVKPAPTPAEPKPTPHLNAPFF